MTNPPLIHRYNERMAAALELVEHGVTDRADLAHQLGITYTQLLHSLQNGRRRGDERAYAISERTFTQRRNPASYRRVPMPSHIHAALNRERRRLRFLDVFDLIEQGETDRAVIAHRLDIKPAALDRWLYRLRDDPRAQRIRALTTYNPKRKQ